MLNAAPGLQVGGFMTRKAEVAAFLPGFKGLLSFGRIVAFIAVDLYHQGMRAGFQEFGL